MKEMILGIGVSILDYEDFIKSINSDIKNNNKKTIIAINPEKIISCKKDRDLFDCIQEADYVIPDGTGIILASKMCKGKIKKRITGIDSMESICDKTRSINAKIFLYGSKLTTVVSAKKRLEKKYKAINIIGAIDGYEKDERMIIDKINKSGANILFVALGSPKQELWIRKNFDKLNVNIIQGVGGSFDVLSGKINRAPLWMQKIGLEWFYRLLKEPSRIFRQWKLGYFLILVLLGKKV